MLINKRKGEHLEFGMEMWSCRTNSKEDMMTRGHEILIYFLVING
jgi:hypothetical protein